MISTNEFKTNVTVTIDGDAWQVVEFQHVKPGKGAAFVRAKMRNMCTGAVVERTFNAGERLPKAHIDRRAMQYLYESDGNYVFMDNETYEQSELTKEQLGNAINFLKENMDAKIMIYNGRVIGVDLPNTVELTVVKTDPGMLKPTRASAAIRLPAAANPQPWTPAMLLKYLCSLTKATYSTLIPVPANTFPAHNITERRFS